MTIEKDSYRYDTYKSAKSAGKTFFGVSTAILFWPLTLTVMAMVIAAVVLVLRELKSNFETGNFSSMPAKSTTQPFLQRDNYLK